MTEAGERLVTVTPEEAEYDLRAGTGAIWSGGRLLVGITAMVFASLAFAYFYLRSANNEDLWRPLSVTAPTALGAAIFALAAASGLLNAYGLHRMRLGFSTDWLVAGATAVTGAALAIALQIYELTRLPFYPGSSGYASCFVGWAVLNVLMLFGGTYWLETVVARGLRLRRVLADPVVPPDVVPSIERFRANLEACTSFWVYLALVSLLFWVLFYVV